MRYKKEWFNDEDFWSRYAPVIFDDKHWAEVPEVADSVTRLAGLSLYGADSCSEQSSGNSGERAPRVLDLCCGMGRITSELARRGFAATGVDTSRSLLETAREDAAYEQLDIEYILADARTFKRPLFFDLAVNLYISFGYFEDPDEDLLLARNVHESLKPGGSFIIETLGKEIAARRFTVGEWFERAGFSVLTEYEAVDSWAALKNRWILVPNYRIGPQPAGVPDRIEKNFVQRLYAATELRSLLFKAGFSAVEIYGGWDERPYDQNAEMLIAVGRKGK
ncbi:MAG: class I SAM-dependent methyltransferase [Treponema sp.]|jgi:SAM-dependent methyltransferase|nr:class I SAM-dependent methyltransferase [Treponema sp.]